MRTLAHRDTAGVGVLDDHTGWLLKALDAFPRRIRVGNVVVGQFLALQLGGRDERTRRGVEVAVKRCRLMGVLTVTQVLQFDETAIGLPRKLAALATVQVVGREVVADGGIVVADAVECRHRQGEAGGLTGGALLTQFTQHAFVLRGVGQHGHVLPVLGGTAHHGWATDIDVFNGVFEGAVGVGHRGLERIQVDDEQVNGANAIRLQRLHVLGHVTARQQTPVYHRVQGFHAAIQHLGKASDIGHFTHGQAGLRKQFGGPAGGDQANAQTMQGLREFDNASFVRDRDECVHEESPGGAGITIRIQV